MSEATSKDDSPLSGTLTSIQDDSISGNPFSSVIEAYFRDYVQTDQIQGGSGSQDKLMDFDFQALNFIQEDSPPHCSSAKPVPVNLFQDSCSLKRNTLPDHQKCVLEDLISKINYHINYFTLDDKSGTKLKLICKLCGITLHIAKVEAHVQNQEHLRNLTERCKEISNTATTASISTEDWKLVDFDESSQHYQCTLCKENLSSSSDSWPKHFQSNSHYSKLKSSKPNSFSHSVATSNSAMNYKPKNNCPDGNNNTVFRAMLEQLKDKDKGTGYNISRKLKGNVTNFKPTYELDKLYFTCKVCNVKLLPKNVEPHAYTQTHLNNSELNLSITKPEVTQKNDNGAKSKGVCSSFAQSDSNKIFSIIAKDLNKQDKNIIEDFGQDSKKILNSFDLVFESEDRLNFICKICRLSLFPKYVKAHLFSCTQVKDARKNKYFVNVEDLNAENKLIVKDLLGKLDLKKLFFFQLHCKYGSNQLGLYCTVCSHNLIPEHVQHHISSAAHSEKVLINPYSLEFESLNQSNKQIVKGLTTAIKDRMKDFSLGYKIGTDQLRFYCKFCQLVLLPVSVEDHVKVKHHLNLVLRNLTFVSFDSLTDTHKEIVENLMLRSKMKLNCIGILRKVGGYEIHIRCTICNLILNPALLPEHVESSDHLNNLKLSAIFNNFAQLEESSKYILNNLYFMFGSKLNVFSLVLDAKLKFKCKVCDVTVFWDTVNEDWLVNHLNNENHSVGANKDTSNNCDKPASKHFSQANGAPAIDKTEESCNLSHYSDRIYPSFASSSLHQTPLKEQIDECVFKNKQSPKIESIEPYNCRDCNAAINFKAEDCNGLRPKPREWLIVNCGGKSTERILSRLKKHEVSKYNAADRGTAVSSASNVVTRNFESNSIQPFTTVSIFGENSVKPKPGVLSESDKEALKMLIDKIGIGIKEFDFMFTASSSKLRLQCKFCSLFMRPETVENHLNSEVHIKYSHLGSMANIEFESLNESNKKVVRQVFKQVGSEINDYYVDTTLCFVCKVCGAKLCPDSVQNHILSEEHLKHFVSPWHEDDAAPYVFGEKSCQDSPSVLAELNRINEGTPCQEKAQFCVQKNLREYAHPLKIEYSDDSDDENDGASSEEIVEISEDSGFASKVVAEECPVEGKVFEATPSEPTELRAYQRTAQPNPPAGFCEVASTAIAVEKSFSSSSYSVSAESIQEICITTVPSTMLLSSPESKSNVTTTPILDDSCRITHEFGHSPTISGSDMAEYKCPPCDRLVNPTSLNTHVNSNEHMIALERKLNGNWDIENAKAFNERIVEMFTGNLFTDDRKVFFNVIEIYYAVRDCSLWFLCRLCQVMVRAEFFQKHWSQYHCFPNDDNSQTSRTSKEICDKMDISGLKITNTEFRLYEKFFCRICDGMMDLKSVLDHFKSQKHVSFVTWKDHPRRFPSFSEYKSIVLRELCKYCNNYFLSDDFEFFLETDSPKLAVYCRQCNKLLQPESLNSHFISNEHIENSKSRYQEEASGKESVKNTTSEILNKPSETSRNASLDRTEETSQKSFSDSCSLM